MNIGVESTDISGAQVLKWKKGNAVRHMEPPAELVVMGFFFVLGFLTSVA